MSVPAEAEDGTRTPNAVEGGVYDLHATDDPGLSEGGRRRRRGGRLLGDNDVPVHGRSAVRCLLVSCASRSLFRRCEFAWVAFPRRAAAARLPSFLDSGGRDARELCGRGLIWVSPLGSAALHTSGPEENG
jgi:hypothetical protein